MQSTHSLGVQVHLQLRGFSVFIDVERLEAGKFDNGLLNSIRQAKNFVLVLTPNALQRCVDDDDGKDWVHRVSSYSQIFYIYFTSLLFYFYFLVL